MKYVIIGLAIVAGIGTIVFASSGDSSKKSATSNAVSVSEPAAVQPQKLTMQTILQDVTAGAKLLDVRSQQEYAAGYIKGAELFPLTDLELSKFPAVSKQTKIYLYCRTGNRSAQAKAILNNQGYTNVIDLGGINDVIALGGIQVK